MQTNKVNVRACFNNKKTQTETFGFFLTIYRSAALYCVQLYMQKCLPLYCTDTIRNFHFKSKVGSNWASECGKSSVLSFYDCHLLSLCLTCSSTAPVESYSRYRNARDTFIAYHKHILSGCILFNRVCGGWRELVAVVAQLTRQSFKGGALDYMQNMCIL